MAGEPRGTAAVKRRLETKNDESRFGLTRAPFFKRRGSLGRGQSLAPHRAAQSGNRKIKEGEYCLQRSLMIQTRNGLRYWHSSTAQP
jgi:hypothetical protein